MDKRVPVADILYIEVMNHRLHIHIRQDEFVIWGSLQEMEEQLLGLHFMRSSHSYMVNLRNVTGLRKDSVLVAGRELPLSRSKRKIYMMKLQRRQHFILRAVGIILNCMADGACLDFMDAVDIYTIFGNALDNAIESVSKLEDPEQRMISVMVFSRADLIFLQVENFCASQPVYNGELPATSKEEEAGYHGFGLKSIRYTAEKYGGFLMIQNEDNIFLFRVTIPIYQ